MRRASLELFRRLPVPVRRWIIRLISPNFTAGAVVVFRRDDGAVLLVKQRHTGAWALPGGLLQRGEDAATAAVREVAEEVGVRLDRARLGPPVAVLDHERRSIDLVFFAPADSHPQVRVGDPIEVTKIGWYDVTALPALTESTVAIMNGAGLTTMTAAKEGGSARS